MCWNWFSTKISHPIVLICSKGMPDMATLIRMPEVAANTDSAVIVSWTKQEGDAVAQGDCLAEIETEKAVIEFNAEQSGVLGKVLVQAGKEVEVGKIGRASGRERVCQYV